jgi:hypothetical protein
MVYDMGVKTMVLVPDPAHEFFIWPAELRKFAYNIIFNSYQYFFKLKLKSLSATASSTICHTNVAMAFIMHIIHFCLFCVYVCVCACARTFRGDSALMAKCASITFREECPL